MMKKQFFTLILNAVILTTNPLWAMDEPDNEHKCPSCHPELQLLQIINEAESKGALFVIPNDALIKILSTLSFQDVVHNVPLVSKAMYNLCQTPFIWSNLCDENPEGNCSKETAKAEYLFYRNLFTDEKQEYILTFPQVQRIVK